MTKKIKFTTDENVKFDSVFRAILQEIGLIASEGTVLDASTTCLLLSESVGRLSKELLEDGDINLEVNGDLVNALVRNAAISIYGLRSYLDLHGADFEGGLDGK